MHTNIICYQIKLNIHEHIIYIDKRKPNVEPCGTPITKVLKQQWDIVAGYDSKV